MNWSVALHPLGGIGIRDRHGNYFAEGPGAWVCLDVSVAQRKCDELNSMGSASAAANDDFYS